jgi:hypothetical protein
MNHLRSALPALLSLLLGAGAAGAAPQGQDAGPPAPTPRGGAKAEAPPIFDPEVDGELALKARWDQCAKSGRRLIVVFGTNDCEACRVVNQGIFEKRFYEELIKQFVPEFIEIAPGSTNAEIPARYGIDPKAPLPGVVIFDPDGRVSEVLAKGEMADVARKGKEAVQLWILDRFYRSKPD